VNNITFSIREGEVFTFLGHNGAGKTTTIYMLTGMLRPTEGDCSVYGFSVDKSIDIVQKNMGLCQQFDVLFDILTVKEHLELVCELKNMPLEGLEQVIKHTMDVVMLTEFKDKRVKELSGGMKRKLSLAMAIVSKPKLIILDEPTSGLDIESRKQIWELIKKIKVGRSIIMSSQHLEEADELADRICIMTKGQLLALDTPQNIKQQFGVGYKILIEPKPNA
jgi:ATP-binding cassette subfamily A (ABC1) protein 3